MKKPFPSDIIAETIRKEAYNHGLITDAYKRGRHDAEAECQEKIDRLVRRLFESVEALFAGANILLPETERNSYHCIRADEWKSLKTQYGGK